MAMKSNRIRLRGVDLAFHVINGRIKLAGDFLDITDRMTPDEIERCIEHDKRRRERLEAEASAPRQQD